ncbi:MAG: hypothetical protein DDT28_00910 [Dehalococcoidia bacterium]|nr:hypothetical protein [Chloroflexota bacterium]
MEKRHQRKDDSQSCRGHKKRIHQERCVEVAADPVPKPVQDHEKQNRDQAGGSQLANSFECVDEVAYETSLHLGWISSYSLS